MSLKELFSGVKPIQIIDHEVFGVLQWSKANNEWSGSYNSLKFTISQEKNRKEPSKEILEYVSAMLSDTEFLIGTLEAEKNRWIEQHQLSDEHMKEISLLNFEELSFFRYKGLTNKILATLSPDSNRSWRLEYTEMECIGLGFVPGTRSGVSAR